MIDKLLLVMMLLNLLLSNLLFSSALDPARSSWCGAPQLIAEFLRLNGGLPPIPRHNIELASEATGVAHSIVSL